MKFFGINLVVANTLSLLLFFIQQISAQQVLSYVLLGLATSAISTWFYTKLNQRTEKSHSEPVQ